MTFCHSMRGADCRVRESVRIVFHYITSHTCLCKSFTSGSVVLNSSSTSFKSSSGSSTSYCFSISFDHFWGTRGVKPQFEQTTTSRLSCVWYLYAGRCCIEIHSCRLFSFESSSLFRIFFLFPIFFFHFELCFFFFRSCETKMISA